MVLGHKMSKFMKHLKLYTAVLTMIAATACVVEVVDENDALTDTNLVEMTITAGTEQETESKASFSHENYPSIEWKKGDKVSIVGRTSGKNQVFTAQSDGSLTQLKGLVDQTDEKFYAVYPYDENIALSNKEGAHLLNVTIPSTQYATANSFDPNAYVAIAELSNSNEVVQFKSACSFLKFRLNHASNVKSVKIEAKQTGGTVTLSGTSGVVIYDNGNPSHGISGTWGPNKTYVELVETDNGHQFTANTDYFIVTRAHKCPYGITVTVTYDNGETFTKSTDSQIFPTPERNKIVNLGILNDGGDLNSILSEVVDFSYAGYKHGEIAPADVYSLGYRVYDVTKYGAIANDGESDREAFRKTLDAALGGVAQTDGNGWIIYKAKECADAIIYFPEGEYILHDTDDKESIVIPAGNIILKGDGRDKTTLVMETAMQPANASQLYSSPKMLQFKHNSAMTDITTVAGSTAAKGSHSIKVSNTAGINAGDWVCLYVKNNSESFINDEIAPYTFDATWTTLKSGVEIYDYHQVKTVNVNTNTVEFVEPLMHEVNPEFGWTVKKFPHYENVGIEDLCFKGNAVANFEHHKDWNHDGGYKPLAMQRLTNSWIRRVDFVNISEACSIVGSANVSAYDINMSGHRGHSAIRSEASSRVLIAGTNDVTVDASGNKGNFHAVGVSKHSIGTVLWRNKWGEDACFESHANQPRATLFDCCTGGWIDGHMGGNANEAPHHLADLTIWNFTATKYTGGEFTWWGTASWKFLPPIIVGFKPSAVTFNPSEVKYDLMHGETPYIESLYEEQLYKRLGYVPTWINELKTINY